jgi:hypothetical protein
MNKPLTITGLSIALLFAIVMVIGLVGVMSYSPTSDNIIHDTREDGTTFVSGDYSLPDVFAVGDVDCLTFEIKVISQDSQGDVYQEDVFYRDCDSEFGDSAYTYLGDIETDGVNYILEIEGDIVIVDSSDMVIPGLAMSGGAGCCCLGSILGIIGLIIGKPKPQVLMIQPDGTIMQVQGQFVQQQPMIGQVINQPQQMVAQPQQNMPQHQETSLDEYSFEHKNEWE